MRRSLIAAAALIVLPALAQAQEVRFGGHLQSTTATCAKRLSIWANITSTDTTLTWKSVNAKEKFTKSETRQVRVMEAGSGSYTYTWQADLEQKMLVISSDRCKWIGYWDGRPEPS